jgi:hypothetical protein
MKLRCLRTNNTLRSFLSGFKWYRKLAGGKWERWWVDCPVNSDIWHEVKHFTHEMVEAAERMKYHPPLTDRLDDLHPYWWGFRPTPLCRGTPELEDWK